MALSRTTSIQSSRMAPTESTRKCSSRMVLEGGSDRVHSKMVLEAGPDSVLEDGFDAEGDLALRLGRRRLGRGSPHCPHWPPHCPHGPPHRHVRQQMRLQVRPLVERLLTEVALVRTVLQVEHFVHGERPRLAEALAALLALERLLPAVDVPGRRGGS